MKINKNIFDIKDFIYRYMKTFEQFEIDPYGEENWNEKQPRYEIGDGIRINGLFLRISSYRMRDDGYYWYDLEDERNYISRREDVLNHIKHPEWSIQKCLNPSIED
jgi:hypothetical protein